MRILTTMVGTDVGTLIKADTVEHDGGLWIVPKWLVSHGEGVQRPAFMIRLDVLPIEKFAKGSPYGDYYLTHEHIPVAVLEGRAETGPHGQYQIVKNPDIEVPVGRA